VHVGAEAAQRRRQLPFKMKKPESGSHASLFTPSTAEQAMIDHGSGDGMRENFSRQTTPSPREVMAEIGRILLCSLGFAAVLEISARVAGLK